MTTMLPPARFEAVQIDEFIVISDLNAPGRSSVTNDADRVVRTVLEYTDLRKRRILYRDSSGTWDGMAVSQGVFAGFVGIGATSLSAAMTAARNAKTWRGGIPCDPA